jgi:hypothetical protein
LQVPSSQVSAGTRNTFVNWSDGGAQTHNVTALAAASTTYTATTQATFLATTSVSPPSGGSIALNPPSADGTYSSGTSVQFTATAAVGYAFVGWGGDLSGLTNPQSLVMNGPHSVVANFQTCTFSLNSSSQAIGAGGGSLIVQGSTIPGCTWVVAGNPSWITLASSTSTQVAFNVAANLSSARSATFTISGLSFTVTQSGNPGLQFVPVVPCRVIDTRNPVGPLGGPFIGHGSSRTIPMIGACGIPATAAAYSVNATVVPRTGSLGFITLWPTGQPKPFVSTLNSLDGRVLANAAIVPAGSGGSIDVFATDDTEFILDVNGYFVVPTAGTFQFYTLPPCRVLDTRNPNGPFGGPAVSGGSSRSFTVPSSGCGAPATAAAYSVNVTVVPRAGLGFLTVWPSGQPQPVVSTLNSYDGSVLANAAIVPAGTGGAINIFATDTTDVIVDINGYFAPPASSGLNFYSAVPCRVVDTRLTPGALAGPAIDTRTARTFPVATGSCGLPSTAAAYSFNVTVVPYEGLGFLTIWPAGVSQPFVSTLNSYAGEVVANAALVPAGTSGSVSVFVTDKSDVILDVNGFFGP